MCVCVCKRRSILESERSRKMVELLLNKGAKVDLSGISLSRLDLSALNMPSIVLVGTNLRSSALSLEDPLVLLVH